MRWVVGSILHGVDPLGHFSFQPVLHDWCNKGCNNLESHPRICFKKKRELKLSDAMFDHGAEGHQIDPSWWTYGAIFCSASPLQLV